jgi:hypothetical protein
MVTNLYNTVVVFLTVFLNVMVTFMICLRLHMAGKGAYTRASMILIESAAPSAILGLVACALVIKGAASSVGVGMVWTMLSVCIFGH